MVGEVDQYTDTGIRTNYSDSSNTTYNYTLSGLIDHTMYDIKIKATNIVGDSVLQYDLVLTDEKGM